MIANPNLATVEPTGTVDIDVEQQFAQDLFGEAETQPEAQPEPHEQGDPSPDTIEDVPIEEQTPLIPDDGQNIGEKLIEATTGIVLKTSTWGVSKKVDADHVKRMADETEANADRLRVSKAIIPRNSAAYKKCCNIISGARKHWEFTTLPHVDQGMRLARKDSLEKFDEAIEGYKASLLEAVEELKQELPELKQQAREELGELYCENDYPKQIDDLFAISWESRAVNQVDDSWKKLHPKLHAEQVAQAARKLEVCVQAAEQEFADQFAVAVEKICQGLNGDEDGKRKAIGESHFGRVTKFIDRFKNLSLGSNGQLDALVAKAQDAIKGVDHKSVKKDVHVSQALAESMNGIAAEINGMMTVKPKRKIKIRKDKKEQPKTEANSKEAELKDDLAQ